MRTVDFASTLLRRAAEQLCEGQNGRSRSQASKLELATLGSLGALPTNRCIAGGLIAGGTTVLSRGSRQEGGGLMNIQLTCSIERSAISAPVLLIDALSFTSDPLCAGPPPRASLGAPGPR